jgi:lysophospholipase L1-like esterase
MVIAPHVGGRVLRVRLTNRLGTDPATLMGVRIARQTEDASIAARSSRRVLFGGSGRITIPAGQEAFSDPVRMRFRPFRPLAISAYVPGVVSAATRHRTAMQTSYLTRAGAGNHASDVNGAAFDFRVTSWLLVDGLDVSTKRRLGSVVAFGDSITDGLRSGIDTNRRYPDYLARRLLRRPGAPPLTVLNAGIAGNELLASGYLPFGPSGLSRARADVIGQAGVSDVILLEGLNDLSGSSAREVISGLRRLIHRLRRHGLHVLLGTLTPSGSAGRTWRRHERVNRWIREHRRSRVVDFARAVRSRRSPRRLARRYDSGDHLHPNASGYRAMAAAIDLRRLDGSTCG